MMAVWDAAWPRFSPAEYLVVGLLVALLMVFTEIRPRVRARWDHPIAFDDAARLKLRAATSRQRRRAGRVSDVLLWTSTVAPFACALATHLSGNADVATQMALICTLAVLASSGANRIATTFAGRPRPYTRVLDRDGVVKRHPTGHPERLRSFFSGHTALTATGMSLLATFAIALGWVQGASLLATVFGAALVIASVGLLRVRADRHYLTDVLAGAIIGLLFGAAYPVLAHFAVS